MQRLISILLVLGLGTVAAQPTPPEGSPRERAGFLGPVERVVIEEEREDAPRRPRQELHYDEGGDPVEFTGYAYDFMDGTLRSTTVTRFGDDGRVLVRETLDPDGEILAQTLYRYDDRGDLGEQVSYDAAGAITARKTFSYDDAGNPLREESYRGADLHRVNTWSYAEDGTVLGRERFDGDGVLLESRSYSEGGSFFEATDYDDDGSVERRSSARLDVRGNFVELVSYDAEGNVDDRSLFSYDENGLMLEQTFMMGESVERVTRYDYEFDAQGNWTVQRQIEDGDVVLTLYRTIDYH